MCERSRCAFCPQGLAGLLCAVSKNFKMVTEISEEVGVLMQVSRQVKSVFRTTMKDIDRPSRWF